MIRVFIISISAFLCLGNADTQKIVTDNDYEKMIIGNWWGEDFFEDGNLRLLGEISYFPNKTSKGTLILQKVVKNKYKEIERKEYECSWIVKNGILFTYDFIEDGNKTARPPIKDKIVNIEADKVVYKNILVGSIFERYRKK